MFCDAFRLAYFTCDVKDAGLVRSAETLRVANPRTPQRCECTSFKFGNEEYSNSGNQQVVRQDVSFTTHITSKKPSDRRQVFL